ncbi:hypothetical protein [Microvirga massiliensis]|uniref:hypothetical protein n=1 Tax=Microvirga massiliensis TaxID=1033741 RepID=UPI0006601149|nr:hypothetical protein [Microvirga massiliensis]
MTDAKVDDQITQDGMSDEEIVRQANDLARQLYALRGYSVREGYRFDRATHPHEREAWAAAVLAFEILRQTDVEDALANSDDPSDDAVMTAGGWRVI